MRSLATEDAMELLSSASDRDICAATDMLKVLSNPIRLRIVWLLAQGEQNVRWLYEQLAMRQSNISSHLKLLRDGGLVECRRDGRSVYYRPSNAVRISDTAFSVDVGG